LTDQAIRVVPAGWYEDPASSAHVRWWNGLSWTEHTAIKPTPQPQPQPVTPTYSDSSNDFANQRFGDGYAGQTTAEHLTTAEHASTATGSTQTPEMLARIAEARDLERQYGISTEENDVIMRSVQKGHTDAASDYRPWNAEPEPEYEEPGTLTASAWFISLWPLLTLVAAATAAYLAFYVMPEPSVMGIPVVAAIVLVPSVLNLIWAAVDARQLRLRDFHPASAGLALLGPLVYLIGRRARVKGSGPLVTLIVLTILAVGGPTAAYLTDSAVPVTKAVEIQQAVQADLVGSGVLASVSCPVIVPELDRGSLYTCDGVLPDGGSKLVWVSIDSDEGDFSYALAVR
jgi:amino acid transporter